MVCILIFYNGIRVDSSMGTDSSGVVAGVNVSISTDFLESEKSDSFCFKDIKFTLNLWHALSF